MSHTLELLKINGKGHQLFIVKCSYSNFYILIFQFKGRPYKYFNLLWYLKQCPILLFIIIACVFVSEYHLLTVKQCKKALMPVISLNQQFIIKTSMGQGECRYHHCIYSIKRSTWNKHPPRITTQPRICVHPLYYLLPRKKKIDLIGDKEIKIDHCKKRDCNVLRR